MAQKTLSSSFCIPLAQLSSSSSRLLPSAKMQRLLDAPSTIPRSPLGPSISPPRSSSTCHRAPRTAYSPAIPPPRAGGAGRRSRRRRGGQTRRLRTRAELGHSPARRRVAQGLPATSSGGGRRGQRKENTARSPWLPRGRAPPPSSILCPRAKLIQFLTWIAAP